MSGPIDIRQVVDGLAARAHELAVACLPGGRVERGEYACGDLSGGPGQSLRVTLAGERRGLWVDFATGEGGDALDLVAQALCHGDKRQAFAWARAWLGLDGRDPRALAVTRRAVTAAREAPAEEADDETRRRWALRLWLGAEPSIADTPVERYLQGRGIELRLLGRMPRALRFHPELPHRASGRAWPAMVAAIVDGAGRHVATHRTWLELRRDGTVGKAPVRDAKMTLGRYAGGAIPLWRGEGGRPLRQAPAGSTVVITEGIEDALTLALARPQHRYLAAVSLANMANVALPESIQAVVLYLDNDGDNAGAERAVVRAIEAHRAAGRSVRLARPPQGVKDANALLLGRAS